MADKRFKITIEESAGGLQEQVRTMRPLPVLHQSGAGAPLPLSGSAPGAIAHLPHAPLCGEHPTPCNLPYPPLLASASPVGRAPRACVSALSGCKRSLSPQVLRIASLPRALHGLSHVGGVTSVGSVVGGWAAAARGAGGESERRSKPAEEQLAELRGLLEVKDQMVWMMLAERKELQAKLTEAEKVLPPHPHSADALSSDHSSHLVLDSLEGFWATLDGAGPAVRSTLPSTGVPRS